MEKKSDPNLLPFKIGLDHEIPKWRATTFLTKEPETIAWIDRYFTAADTLDLQAPLQPGPITKAVRDRLLTTVAGPGPDRYLSPEPEAAVVFVQTGGVLS